MVVQLPVQTIIHRVVVVYGIGPRSSTLPGTVTQPRWDIVSVPVLTYLQITLRPALRPYLHRGVRVIVHIGYRGRSAGEAWCRCRGREAHLIAISRAHSVRGIGSYIVEGRCHQARKRAAEYARACSVGSEIIG